MPLSTRWLPPPPTTGTPPTTPPLRTLTLTLPPSSVFFPSPTASDFLRNRFIDVEGKGEGKGEGDVEDDDDKDEVIDDGFLF